MQRVNIPKKLLKHWENYSGSILDWKWKGTSDVVLFKFAYHVEDGEFIFGMYPDHHKVLIWNYGKHKFEEYIRGIYFREKKIVYLRGHEREDWLKKTEKMLRENGVGEEIRIMWGKEAAEKLKEDLKEL